MKYNTNEKLAYDADWRKNGKLKERVKFLGENMNEIIENCIEKVAEIFKQFPDKNKNEWTFKTTGLKKIISGDDFDSIENEQYFYKKKIRLKKILQKYFCSDNGGDNGKNRKLAEWIVKDWGKISSVKNFDPIINDIKLFYSDKDKLNNIELSKEISSRSKVLSFLSPKEYVICDSRNIFALNWLFYFAQCDKGKIHLFKPLAARNTIIPKYSLEIIANIVFDKKIEYSFVKYSDFCDTIIKIAKKIGHNEIYQTEMELFSISVDENQGIPFYIKKKLREMLEK